MNYTAALSGEYGPLWRDTFAARDLKVWNDARIVHDLYVDGSIHCDGFAVPAVDYDTLKVNKAFWLIGDGAKPSEVTFRINNGIASFGGAVAVEEALGCAQFIQTGKGTENEFQGDLIVDGDLTVKGTINHSGKFNPPLAAAALPSVGPRAIRAGAAHYRIFGRDAGQVERRQARRGA